MVIFLAGWMERLFEVWVVWLVEKKMDINMVNNTDVGNEFSGLVRFVECIE